MEIEKNSYAQILERVLARIPDTLDKREGSVIFDAVAPACYEIAEIYLNLNVLQQNNEAATATREYLTELAYQNGTFRKLATKAQRKGTFSKAVSIGSRFSIENLNYVVKELIANFDYMLEAEVAGESGNNPMGDLIPIDYIDGLEFATLSNIITPGTDDESDDSLRERYRSNITNPPQDGNASQYLDWANNYVGIGAAKVYPLWNGGNTVKIAITNGLFLPADAPLVAAFQTYMDPSSSGLGNGVAPIGSKVTVVGGVKKDINITGNVVLTEGYQTAEGVAESISDYLASITYKKDSVSYMRVGSAILDCASIVDISSLTINNGTTDIALVGEEIPVLNSINLTVVS